MNAPREAETPQHMSRADYTPENMQSRLRGALAAIIADPDCCAASKAIARDALAGQNLHPKAEQSEGLAQADQTAGRQVEPGTYRVGDILVVQPALEPSVRGIFKIGRFAAFFYVRWSTIGLGVEILSAGAALIIGPLMFGVCHIKRELAAGDAVFARDEAADHIERLTRALEPFANEAENYDFGDGSGPDLDDSPDASSLNEISDITVGDLRRAREALQPRGAV